MLEQALEKLRAGRGDTRSLGRAAQVMARPVADALEGFCRQDGEFAQAVVQGGGFADCMRAVAKDCGSALSDAEAYRRAVQFYFPGAEVRVTMTIDLCPGVEEESRSGGGLLLNLTDFL